MSLTIKHATTLIHFIPHPFVYVDTDGAMKLVTNVVDSMGGENEIFALSMANDGFMEFLAFLEAEFGDNFWVQNCTFMLFALNVILSKNLVC